VNLRSKLDWFERLPLFGKRVLVTRTRKQGSSLTKRLGTLGALPIEVPTVEIETLQTNALDEPIQNLSDYSWLVFTSANAVECFFTALVEKGHDTRALGSVKIAAIGPATADSLKSRGITSDILPSTYSSEALAEMFSGFDLLNKKVLIPRSAAGGDPITNKLTAAGALVEDVPIYRPATPPGTSETLTGHLQDGIDIATFTSSSTVTNLINLLGGSIQLRGVTIACIGPMTAETAESHGLNVDIVASTHTVDGLVDALVEVFEPQT
jgi:uroporphyrinogen III methyltransferase/synthase